LTGSFINVYAFTVPFVLTKRDSGRKDRVVNAPPSFLFFRLSRSNFVSRTQHSEVIGSPPYIEDIVTRHVLKCVAREWHGDEGARTMRLLMDTGRWTRNRLAWRCTGFACAMLTVVLLYADGEGHDGGAEGDPATCLS
jgi:hypothetical protein